MSSKQMLKKDGLVTQAVWLAMGGSIGLVLSLILPLVLVRKLSRNEFGLYKQAFQILMTFISLLGLQFGSSVYYFMPREPSKKQQLAMNVVLFYGVLGSAAALSFALFPGWITIVFRGNDLVPSAPLIGAAILLGLVASSLEGFMVANGEARLASVWGVVLQLTKAILLILVAVLFGSIRAIMLAAVIQGALQCAVLLAYLYRRFGQFWLSFDGHLLRAQIFNALPFGLGTLAGSVQNDLHNYFVSHYFDPAQFAIYSVGCFQVPLLRVYYDAIETVMSPEAGRLRNQGSYKRMISLWLNAIRAVSFCFVPACVSLFVLRREFIVVLFTKNYAGSVPIFAVSLLNLLLSFPTGALMRPFEELKYFRVKLYLVLLPISWATLYAGIHAFGLIGAIMSTVVVRFLDSAITAIVVGRRLGVQWGDLAPVSSIPKIGAAAAAAASITLMVKPALANLPGIGMLGACFFVFGLVYLIAAVVVGAVTSEEKDRVGDVLLGLYRTGFVRTPLSRASEG